jgi:hypothetical protein
VNDMFVDVQSMRPWYIQRTRRTSFALCLEIEAYDCGTDSFFDTVDKDVGSFLESFQNHV